MPNQSKIDNPRFWARWRAAGAVATVVSSSLSIAVSIAELNEFGCPHCGYRSGSIPISTGGSVLWQCGDCSKFCYGLGKGVTKSVIGSGGFYPELRDHPRRGIPAHGTPDKKPEGGGEFFRSRGLGSEWNLL